MTIETPAVRVVGGKLTVDFKPEIHYDWPVYFKFNSAGKDLKGIERMERKAVVDYFGLVDDHNLRRSNERSWYIGRGEAFVFWEVFDAETKVEDLSCQGLNLVLYQTDWGERKNPDRSESRTHYHNSEIDPQSLTKVSLLKKDTNQKLKLRAESQLGDLIADYIVKGNWIEWTIMKIVHGRKVAFSVPDPGWMNSDLPLMAPAIDRAVRAGWDEGLKTKHQEASRFLEFLNMISSSGGYDSNHYISQLIKKWYRIWPWYSEIHTGLQE